MLFIILDLEFNDDLAKRYKQRVGIFIRDVSFKDLLKPLL